MVSSTQTKWVAPGSQLSISFKGLAFNFFWPKNHGCHDCSAIFGVHHDCFIALCPQARCQNRKSEPNRAIHRSPLPPAMVGMSFRLVRNLMWRIEKFLLLENPHPIARKTDKINPLVVLVRNSRNKKTAKYLGRLNSDLKAHVYSTLLHSTLISRHMTALLYSALLYSALLYSALLYSALRYSTLLCSTLLCSTPLYSTLLCSTLLYSALPTGHNDLLSCV